MPPLPKPQTGDLFAPPPTAGAGAEPASASEPPRTTRSPGAGGPVLTAYCDGGARGNPGPAGYGAEVRDGSGNVVAELSEFLGVQTNNVAEYQGLLGCLQYALEHNAQSLEVVSDSLLMVKQVQGHYKVKSPDLQPLWQEARRRIAKLGRFSISHALRHKNKAADRLANEAMDRGMGRPVPATATPYPNQRSQPPEPKPSKPAVAEVPIVRNGGAAQARPGETETVASPQPAMLRGFTRDGVVHILGSHTLPNGRFVKIIPE